MPISPNVKFEYKNDNILQTIPTLGISCILARTTKGPANDPSNLITSLSEFRRIFGNEIVPDGSVSNIEKALVGGSKLRVIRVLGKGAKKGEITIQSKGGKGPETGNSILKVISDSTTVELGFTTKGFGDPIGSGSEFKIEMYKQSNTLYYKVISANGQVLEQGPIITYATSNTVNNTSVDYIALSNFNKNSSYLNLIVTKPTDSIKTLTHLTAWLSESVDNTKNPLNIKLANDTEITEEVVNLTGNIGNPGTIPTTDEWVASLEFIKDYTDAYNVFCSHINQHINKDQDVLKVHKVAVDIVKELEEFIYYIEVPKHLTHYSQGDQPRDYKAINTWIQTCLGKVGNSKFVAYFGGGIRYYNDDGNLVDSDVLGTICGLSDSSASNYGPWRSFAGMNRGVIYDGNGPVCPNYGSPSRYSELNSLAQNYCNIICIKDTPNAGKRTMLWHCFTSQIKQDSERFLSIVRLNLYLKKNIRPILEKYLEEPNIWHTWKNIYLEVKPILDDVQERDGFSEYKWLGDQDANSYKDLAINNEVDVRQGKYKIILKYKDIVPMQEITVGIHIDQASRDINIETINE